MDRALLIADNLQGPEGNKFQHLSGRGFLTITGVMSSRKRSGREGWMRAGGAWEHSVAEHSGWPIRAAAECHGSSGFVSSNASSRSSGSNSGVPDLLFIHMFTAFPIGLVPPLAACPLPSPPFSGLLTSCVHAQPTTTNQPSNRRSV